MVDMQTDAPGTRCPLPKGESDRQTCPQRKGSTRRSRWAEYHDAARRRRSTAYRRRVGARRASLAQQAARGRALPRPPQGAGRHPVGGAHRLLLARDARGVWQMAERLPPLRVVGKAGYVAAHPPSAGRRGVTGTGDQIAVTDAVGPIRGTSVNDEYS